MSPDRRADPLPSQRRRKHLPQAEQCQREDTDDRADALLEWVLIKNDCIDLAGTEIAAG
jgi:hypothetical protein